MQDCSTLVTDLSGSEFFGHERGAFTGALSERQGRIRFRPMAVRCFLTRSVNSICRCRAQLLRVIQEGTYKRVGGYDVAPQRIFA